MAGISQKLLGFLILFAVLYDSYASSGSSGSSGNSGNSNPPGFSNLDDCENQCTGSNEVCNLITGPITWSGSSCDKDRWECVIGCSFTLLSPTFGDVVISGSLVGLPDDFRYDVGATATYSCDHGYYMSGGTNPRLCQADGTWSGSRPFCYLVTCPSGQVSAPEDGSVTFTASNYFESVATFTCDDGYDLIGECQLVCLSDGNWSGSKPSCTLTTCPVLSDPTNGDVVVTDEEYVGSIATYTCDGRYDLIGVSELVCLGNGSWSNDPPSCTLTTCPSLTAPTSGSVSLSDGEYVESIATFSCNLNYYLVGDCKRFCLSTGSWSGSTPSCMQTTCGGLSNPTDGSLDTSNGNFVGSIATYTCDEGFELTGLSQLVCLGNGSWSESAPTCTPVECCHLPTPSNGSVSIAGTSYGDEATFACDAGFILIGPATRECLGNGTWSGDMPYCVDEDCPVVYTESDFPTRVEDGITWRLFWWFDSTNGDDWPSAQDEDDVLGDEFGCCDISSHYCFGRLPDYLSEDTTDLLAVDSNGNIFRWSFDSSNPTAHGAWLAFHDGIETQSNVLRHSGTWAPTIVSGGPNYQTQDSWMYRTEHGVKSFILDDDNCDCYTTLNAGHAMCYAGFSANYGTEHEYGVGLLNENGCSPSNGPSSDNSLFLFYAGGFNTVFGDLNQYKIVVPLFGAAYAAPNKVP